MDGETLAITFAEPVTRPTSGQLAVLYDAAGRVLAGGVLEDAAPGAADTASGGLVIPAKLG